ncbi:MAG: ribosome biogenesis/translation initiation ATPase RLI [Candidatus Diapherotrites archaeon CG10_big_fil_rev_8_21_14_0_10_31_34]|nr:MAG: ribosome biogenesis/translation initiation ATPase RLI [Candidatus Diapherotrites archaeon CG10_big_fil_rev_8_21_14_0_10_31_34]
MALKKRIAVLDYDKCHPIECGNFLCIRMCPVNRTKKECIIENEKNFPEISEELCIGCQICVVKCPFDAISIINKPAELDFPIHQFSKNSFRLYNLPYPKNSAVVGLIGKNGIGKSTVLKILSNELTPNLGNFDETPSIDKVLEKFKGKQLMNFFNSAKKDSKLSFKPQRIELIPKKAKGKVLDLLKKIDERNKLNELIELLDLKEILNKEIKTLSGGELQRIAIAATALKQADYYFFDEPSSFLDIKQRLNMAKVINSLAESNKSVLIVEHDLAVLDYLSEYIHVFYGSPGVYGVVSSVKSSRNGINEFLNGYLKDENLKFRSKELSFEVKPPQKSRKTSIFFSYPFLEKKFPGFSLKIEEGNLRQGEVIGIVGGNALGKTTFVRMLAGEIKPDNTKLDFKLKISFKSQQLNSEKKTVRELFSLPEINKDIFNSEFRKKLSLDSLMDSDLSNLSGGELQKVAVAFCLSKEADLYLLDEPSAFIDVEDRLKIAEAIRSIIEKKGKTALIVDHDVLFIDYISDRLIVFEGITSVSGKSFAPQEMHSGMNFFLKEMSVTFRRDPETGRPRANKLNSIKDKEQKQKGEYYYSV